MAPPLTAVRSSRAATDLDDAVAEFAHLRPRLLGIAYRILGRWAEAEDIAQDAWVRWQTCDRTVVISPTAFLVTTTTRLALNAAQSARARHESYLHDRLPEPIDTRDDPATAPERTEALETGITRLLERLSPTERAAYILRHAFEYPYTDVARVIETTEINARQLVSRASRRLAMERARSTPPGEPRRLVHTFVAASRLGAVAALEQLLANDLRRHATV